MNTVGGYTHIMHHASFCLRRKCDEEHQTRSSAKNIYTSYMLALYCCKQLKKKKCGHVNTDCRTYVRSSRTERERETRRIRMLYLSRCRCAAAAVLLLLCCCCCCCAAAAAATARIGLFLLLLLYTVLCCISFELSRCYSLRRWGGGVPLA